MQAVVRLWLLYVFVLTIAGPPLVMFFNTTEMLDWFDRTADGTTCLTPVETPQPASSDAAEPDTALAPLDFWGGAFHYMVRYNHPAHVLMAYSSAVYAVILVWILYRRFLASRVVQYDTIAIAPVSLANLKLAWVCCIGGVLVCGLLLLHAHDYSHPFTNALYLDWRDLNQARIQIARQSVPGVYSLGINLFGCAALLIALGYLKRWWLIVPTILAVGWLATFQLSKSALSYVVIEVVVIGLALRLFSLRTALVGLGIAAVVAAAAIVLSLKSHTLTNSLVAFAYRLLLGEFSDLPNYFCVFESQRVALDTMLPAWLKSLTGIVAEPAGRTVMLATVLEQNLKVAGVANTFLTGEAYAVLGIFGVLVAPLLVFANIALIVKVFRHLPVNLLSGMVLGYLLFKLMIGTFSGISIYIFSSLHVVLATFLISVLAIRRVRRIQGTVNIPRANR